MDYMKACRNVGSISHQAHVNALRLTQSRGRLTNQFISVEIMGPCPTVHFQDHHLDLALNVAEVITGQEIVVL